MTKEQKTERRDVLAIVRKFGVERETDMKDAGNSAGARTIKDLTRDLTASIKARYKYGDENE